MNGLQRLWQQLNATWQGMSTARRTSLVIVAVIVLAGVVGVVVWSSQVEYRLLVAGLSSEEAGAVTAKLQAQGVPFKLGASGTSILVPAEQVAQLRVSLANDGLSARSGKGFELFDESSLGMTPFVQNVNYSRALQSELARSIQQMDSIATARVHIVRPEQSPFVRDQKPTTAGVVLKMKLGSTLNRSTLSAIASLVSHSVEGLAPENVTVMDTTGKLLSDLHSAEDGVPNTQLEYRRDLEQYLATKAEELLGKSLGYGKVIVKVAADINFKRVKEKKETYSPEDKVIVSERVTNSNSSSGNTTKGGVAGATSNTGRPSAASGSGSGSSKEETTQTDYLVSKTVQEYEDKMGHIERLTVAAMVDIPAGASGTATSISLDEVGDIIKQAVGFKQGRDEIKVSNVKLPNLLPPEEPDEDALRTQRWQAYFLMARNVSIGLSAVLGMVLGFMFLRRIRPRTAPATPAPANIAGAAGPAGGTVDAALSELTAAARQDPAMVARLLVGMMS